MAKNFVQPGCSLTLLAPYDITSGKGALIGAIFGVAQFDALSGVDCVFTTDGVWELTKVSAQAWAIGQKIYWDAAAKNCTTVAAGNAFIGAATAVAANPSATGYVRLNEVASAGVGEPVGVSMAAAAGGANVTEVTITAKDAAGNTVAAPYNFDLWLSDDAAGAGLTATTASGAVGAKTSSGADLAAYTAKKALRVQTLATGVYILSITDTAKTAFKVCAQIGGRTIVGMTLAAGNYG
ncbi:DUF2190 family protein [Methylosinus sp. R-45379]|uniref:DUF2190 family protein n=1 Tax=Methylosinus sp. R-45379 TaxID=980563 RepID=UPI0007C891DD|nr:DUF2190 family protein [Methylosinus sp. R-45379]